MTTSGVYDLSKTANEIVGGILRYLQVIGEGQSPSGQQEQDVIEAINYWLLQQKGPPHIGRPGLMMWLRESEELSLTEDQYLYELKPSGGDLDIQIPTEIMFAAYRNTDSEDTMLQQITRVEYEAITAKTTAGTPAKFHYDKRLDVGNLYVYPAPDSDAANGVINLIYRQPLEVVTSGSETLDVENSWYRAIKFNVALDVAAEYGIEPTQAMYNRATDSMAALNTFYPENIGELFFEPDKEYD